MCGYSCVSGVGLVVERAGVESSSWVIAEASLLEERTERAKQRRLSVLLEKKRELADCSQPWLRGVIALVHGWRESRRFNCPALAYFNKHQGSDNHGSLLRQMYLQVRVDVRGSW